MEDLDKVEILEEIINNSKEYRFITDDILNIKQYYGNKSININFIALIETMLEKLDDEDIDRILLLDEEVE